MFKRVIFIIVIIVFLTVNQDEIFKRPIISEAINVQEIKSLNTKITENKNVKNSKINDPYYNKQWSIEFTKSEEAWMLVDQKRDIKVAVVDSGVDYNHPDLKNRVLTNLGYNFIDNTKNTMDDLGHGTEVAGVIAAQEGNNIGITGIVGGLGVKIIPIKVLDSKGQGPSDIVAKGIIYGVDVGADIINVSIDFQEHDEDIQSALSYAYDHGVLVVVASGNSNSNCDNYSPAGDAGAYTVAAITEKYEHPEFSSYGNSVSVVAPGVDVLTTTLSGEYGLVSGTSISAPIVSGIAAMIKAENPALTPEEITNLINTTATKVLGSGKDKATGYGLINAYKAVLGAK